MGGWHATGEADSSGDLIAAVLVDQTTDTWQGSGVASVVHSDTGVWTITTTDSGTFGELYCVVAEAAAQGAAVIGQQRLMAIPIEGPPHTVEVSCFSYPGGVQTSTDTVAFTLLVFRRAASLAAQAITEP